MANDGQREPLLKKRNYHENCPGCKVDQMKERQRGLPFKDLFTIWVIVLCAALPISSLFPFLYFMIRDFHIASRPEDINYYAGYVGASFMLGRTLTSVLWGMAADRYGRKPVIVIGTTSVVIFNTLFGLSCNYWMALLTRFLLGALNGLLGPIKAYATEIFRPEYQALALSSVSTSWGIGLIIGPALGGFLAQPAEKYPHIFPPDSIFGRFPYFLPCLFISLFALIVTISTFWLPETLHMHPPPGDNTSLIQSSRDDSEAAITVTVEGGSINGDGYKIEAKEGREEMRSNNNKWSLIIRNWPLMSSIIVYCIFSLHDMAYSEIFSLWAVSPRRFGGLSFSTQEVGEVLAVTGFGLLLFQLSLYPIVEKMFGPIRVTRYAGVLAILVLTSYPYIAMLSGFALSFLINCASLLKNILTTSIITGTFILQNNAVEQNQRGLANGIAMTGMSLCKTIGPAVGGALLSWAQKRQDAAFLPGDQIVFFILNVVEAIGVLMTFKPFLAVPQR